ncbi:hypothetical protein [Streptomyces xanthophaeus]
MKDADQAGMPEVVDRPAARVEPSGKLARWMLRHQDAVVGISTAEPVQKTRDDPMVTTSSRTVPKCQWRVFSLVSCAREAQPD